MKDSIAYLKRVPEEKGFMIDICVHQETQLDQIPKGREGKESINRLAGIGDPNRRDVEEGKERFGSDTKGVLVFPSGKSTQEHRTLSFSLPLCNDFTILTFLSLK